MKFTADEDAYIIAHYATMRIDGIAAGLGRSYDSAQGRIARLLRDGGLQAEDRCYQPRWTAEQARLAEALIEQGLSVAEIGARVGRSGMAVGLWVRRQSGRIRGHRPMTARDVARAMGGLDSKVVARWIDVGWLEVRRGIGAGPNCRWWVEVDALIAFIGDERTWHAWTPERIADGELRAWALARRGQVRYLTPGEVGARFGLTSKTVNSWIRRGQLPARRWGNWRVLESDLAGFEPPGARSKAGMVVRRFSAAEDARLRSLRASGLGWTAIGAALGRNPSSIEARYKLLAKREGAA